MIFKDKLLDLVLGPDYGPNPFPLSDEYQVSDDFTIFFYDRCYYVAMFDDNKIVDEQGYWPQSRSYWGCIQKAVHLFHTHLEKKQIEEAQQIHG